MFTKDDIIVIPARKGSKGVPFKNRKLIETTLSITPDEYKPQVYISTDDKTLINKYQNDYNVIPRDPLYAQDTTSTKQTLQNLFKVLNKTIGNCILLYTVYPERKWSDVISFYNFFLQSKAYSVLGKKEVVDTHPYLMLYEQPNNKGTQLIPHNLYRRQDYPKVFELSHYVSIFNINKLDSLNDNLYNNDTLYYDISCKDTLNIDNQKDIIQWEKQK